MSSNISIVIVNYNAGDLLHRCVESLLCCPLTEEVIVVDNNSTDGSLEALVDLSRVKIVRNESNFGFAVACNQGLRIAKSPLLLFINPDCVVHPNALSILQRELIADSSVGMAGGFLANSDGSEQAGGRRAVPTPWRSFVRAFGLVRLSRYWPRLFFDFNLNNQPLPDKPTNVEAISGACMLVRREAVQDVGEWDEGYFLHCEDLDWCMRFRMNGWKIIFVPSARIDHALGVCGKGRPIFVEWHKHKGMMRFYRKFFLRQYSIFLTPLVAIAVWLHFSAISTCHLGKHVGKLFRLERE